MPAAMPPFVVADVSAALNGALAKSANVRMNDDSDAALAVLASGGLQRPHFEPAEAAATKCLGRWSRPLMHQLCLDGTHGLRDEC